MPNTLGLDDDDDVEVLIGLEHAFDIALLPAETERIITVGELYDLLLRKIPPNDADLKCANAMAFYRIRSALRRLGHGEGLTLVFDMRVLERGRTKANIGKLEVESGLRMPDTVPTRAGWVASCCGFVVTLAGMFSLQPGVASVFLGLLAGLIPVGVILRVDPGRLPANCGTLADLARRTAALNYGRLVKMGARHRDGDIWENLTEVLSVYALPKSEITRETVLLHSQFKKRAA